MRMLSTILATLTLAGFQSSNANADYQRWIDISNTEGSAVESIYIAHIDDPFWGSDLLGDYFLDPGYTTRVTPENAQGYCRFDIKIVYVDGSADVFRHVNLCSETNLVV